MSRDSEPDSEKSLPRRFQATLVAHYEVFAALDHLLVDTHHHEPQRGDGRWAVHATVTEAQLAPLVEAGVTVTLERVIDPCYRPRVAPAEPFIERVEKVAREVFAKSSRASGSTGGGDDVS